MAHLNSFRSLMEGSRTCRPPRPATIPPDLLPVARHLENIACNLPQVFSSRDKVLFQSLVDRHFAPDVQVLAIEPFAHIIHSNGREEFAQQILKTLETMPALVIEAYNATTSIDRAKGVAQVFTTHWNSGTFNDNPMLERESVLHYTFKRNEMGEWLCTRLDILRGPGHGLFGHATQLVFGDEQRKQIVEASAS